MRGEGGGEEGEEGEGRGGRDNIGLDRHKGRRKVTLQLRISER